MLKHRYLFVFISGILFSLPFIFPELSIISFFTAVPFFMIIFDALKNNRKNKIIKYTFVFGMSFYLPVYTWFLWMYPMEQTGITPIQSAFIVIAAWLGFSLMQTFIMLILPVGLKIFRNIYISEKTKVLFMPVLTAYLYVILEWTQSWFMSGLTWAKLSISQYRNLFFIQSVSVFGTYFTGFIIIFINASIALYILNKSNKKNNILIFAAVILYFANTYFGFFRVIYHEYIETGAEKQKITAQVMQGNVSSYDKWENGAGSSLSIYQKLLEDYSYEKADICVFPETAIPVSVSRGSSTYEYLKSLAEENNITILTGIFYYNPEEDKRYNAIMAFDKNHDFTQPYGKQHLVPFGEYLPLENIITKIFPFVTNISLFDSVITPGENSNVMNINGINYGGLVCFDSIFPELARKSVKDGADVLIVVTNDSWFRDSMAIYQHNAQSVLRAVENNRYVIRAANTGISSVISPTGKIITKSNVFETTVLSANVGVIKNKTIYTLAGDIILYLAFGYILFCAILKIKIKNGAP